jgi:hypothetical protein
MDAYIRIEKLVADKYGRGMTTRKAVGDFMLSDTHAVNVKSNNVAKQNYSPNMLSIQKMHKWVFEQRCDLSFVFVDYKEEGGKLKILKQTKPIPIEQISWDCLSIEAQGYGVIQMCRPRKIVPSQTKSDFYRGFLAAYAKYRQKEKKKHDKFAKRFIKDPDAIDW